MSDLKRIWEILWDERPASADEVAEVMLNCTWLSLRHMEKALELGASLPHDQLPVINACIARLEEAKGAVREQEKAA